MQEHFAWFSICVAIGALGCSGDAGVGAPPEVARASGPPGNPRPGESTTGTITNRDGGQPDASPTSPSRGSGGHGGPGPGEHSINTAIGPVALHVPGRAAPMPLVILLHGQGDTGRNFLDVWLARGLPDDVLIASPDDNHDDAALVLEQEMRAKFDVDLAKRYVLGFSQGGAYASFLLYDAAASSRFAGIVLASSGLAQDPSTIPNAGKSAPAVAVVIDPTDPNNTWNQGRRVMEDFVPLLAQRGYDAKLWLHTEGHSLASAPIGAAMKWALAKEKSVW